MSQFWEQLRASRMEHGWAWRVFLRSCFPGWLTSTFCILGKMSLNMIWSLNHDFHHPSPWWRMNSKHVCLCLPVGWFRGQVWVSFCWGWAQGFCLRWSIPYGHPTDARPALGGCFGVCFWVRHLATDERIITWLRGRSKINICQVTNRWNELKWHKWRDKQWMASCFFVSICN